MSTVHLVDDEAPVRAALEFLLASHNLKVCSYDGGPALLARIAHPYHLHPQPRAHEPDYLISRALQMCMRQTAQTAPANAHTRARIP